MSTILASGVGLLELEQTLVCKVEHTSFHIQHNITILDYAQEMNDFGGTIQGPRLGTMPTFTRMVNDKKPKNSSGGKLSLDEYHKAAFKDYGIMTGFGPTKIKAASLLSGNIHDTMEGLYANGLYILPEETREGVLPEKYEVYSLRYPSYRATKGTFRIRSTQPLIANGPEYSSPLDFDATNEDIQYAMTELFPGVQTTVTGGPLPRKTVYISFVDHLAINWRNYAYDANGVKTDTRDGSYNVVWPFYNMGWPFYREPLPFLELPNQGSLDKRISLKKTQNASNAVDYDGSQFASILINSGGGNYGAASWPMYQVSPYLKRNFDNFNLIVYSTLLAWLRDLRRVHNWAEDATFRAIDGLLNGLIVDFSDASLPAKGAPINVYELVNQARSCIERFCRHELSTNYTVCPIWSRPIVDRLVETVQTDVRDRFGVFLQIYGMPYWAYDGYWGWTGELGKTGKYKTAHLTELLPNKVTQPSVFSFAGNGIGNDFQSAYTSLKSKELTYPFFVLSRNSTRTCRRDTYRKLWSTPADIVWMWPRVNTLIADSGSLSRLGCKYWNGAYAYPGGPAVILYKYTGTIDFAQISAGALSEQLGKICDTGAGCTMKRVGMDVNGLDDVFAFTELPCNSKFPANGLQGNGVLPKYESDKKFYPQYASQFGDLIGFIDDFQPGRQDVQTCTTEELANFPIDEGGLTHTATARTETSYANDHKTYGTHGYIYAHLDYPQPSLRPNIIDTYYAHYIHFDKIDIRDYWGDYGILPPGWEGNYKGRYGGCYLAKGDTTMQYNYGTTAYCIDLRKAFVDMQGYLGAVFKDFIIKNIRMKGTGNNNYGLSTGYDRVFARRDPPFGYPYEPLLRPPYNDPVPIREPSACTCYLQGYFGRIDGQLRMQYGKKPPEPLVNPDNPDGPRLSPPPDPDPDGLLGKSLTNTKMANQIFDDFDESRILFNIPYSVDEFDNVAICEKDVECLAEKMTTYTDDSRPGPNGFNVGYNQTRNIFYIALKERIDLESIEIKDIDVVHDKTGIELWPSAGLFNCRHQLVNIPNTSLNLHAYHQNQLGVNSDTVYGNILAYEYNDGNLNSQDVGDTYKLNIGPLRFTLEHPIYTFEGQQTI